MPVIALNEVGLTGGTINTVTWLLADGAHLTEQTTREDYDAGNFIVPEGARFLFALSGRPALNTASGLPSPGDYWTDNGRLYLCTGHGIDFGHSEVKVLKENRSTGRATVRYARVGATGNLITFKPGEWNGEDTSGITKEVPGLTIGQNEITIDEPVLHQRFATARNEQEKAQHSVAYDNAVHNATGTPATSMTLSLTVGGGSNRYVAGLTASWDAVTANSNVSGITYAGNAMTSVGAMTPSTSPPTGSASYLTAWGYVNPASGANNVVATFVGSCNEIQFGAISADGVDQTTPASTFAMNHANNSNITLTMDSALGELGVCMCYYEGNGASSVTPTSGVERWDMNWSFQHASWGATLVGASPNITITGTGNGSSPTDYDIAGFSIKAASGGGGTVPPVFYNCLLTQGIA